MTLRLPLAALPALLLAACDVTLPWSSGTTSAGGSGLSLGQSAVDFSADYDGPIPAAKAIPIQVTNPEAAYVGFGGRPAWLGMTLGGTAGAQHVQVAVTGTHLDPGTLEATVQVVILRADESLIASRDLHVTYTVRPSLLAAPDSLTFSHVLGGTTGTQRVALGGSPGTSWTATASEPWVTLGATSGATPSSLTVGVDPAGLAPGAYLASISLVGAGRSSFLPVRLEVRQPSLVVSAPALSFAAVNGAPLAAQSFDVSVDSGAAVAFTAVPGAGWVVLDQASGTTPARVSVAVDPSIGPLPSGSHLASIGLAATAGGVDLHASVSVAASLSRPAFSVPAALTLGGQDGRDLGAKTLGVSLDTGGSSHPWTATPSHAWMSLPVTSGTISSAPLRLDVVPVAAGLTGGTRTGSVAFSATVNGDVVEASVPVTFNLDTRELRVSRLGVALTSTPGASRLARTLTVTDSFGLAVPWTAASDQAWLTVTASGTTAGDLAIAADPTGLAADALHLAQVTVSAAGPAGAAPATVRVGLWVGSAAPPAEVTVDGVFTELVADPVRPYAYAHSNGSTLSVFNVHTGERVATVPAVGGSLAGMTVSGDGAKLYVVDKATWKVVPVDLDTRAVQAAWGLASTGNVYPRAAWTLTDGRPLLVVTDGTVRDAATAGVLGTFFTSDYSPPRVTTSGDGRAFCAPGCRSLSYSRLGGGALTVGTLLGAMGDRDGALNEDGSIVYAPYVYPGYHWRGFSTATGAEVIQLSWQKPYPGNVEVGWDGRIYGGRYGGLSYEPDVFVFDPSGAEVGSLKVQVPGHELLDDRMVLSGDGLRVLAALGSYSGTGRLRFVIVP